MDKAKVALRLLCEAGMKKLNISGGEPFLNPKYIGEIFKFCKEELNLESTSVVCNGSKVTDKWMREYGKYLDVMAISCDSFNSETNEKQGRGETGKGSDHISNVQDVTDLCKMHGIRVKINSVITMQAIFLSP
jgi:radical S-adenosyl methionine domain-containing protein 2